MLAFVLQEYLEEEARDCKLHAVVKAVLHTKGRVAQTDLREIVQAEPLIG